MGLDNAYGVGSLKPGICTSSTRPASPFDGQVIYETDTNTLAVWDGSGWVSLNPVDRDRNVIINGAMQIAQRGTSTASITSSGYYTADRWVTFSDLGTWTQSVENDAPTGSGFRKSLKMLCTTANASPSTGLQCNMRQRLEGQNLQHFRKGTSSALSMTISFWVKSNVTGTFIVALEDTDNTRYIASTYTVNASATWEKKTVTFSGDTTGAFDNNNESSLHLIFWLGAGTSFTSGTLHTIWASRVNANSAVGQVNVAAATNNYWQITGVQLEAGAVATPFEFEDYGTTLAKCQRYFFKQDTVPDSFGISYSASVGVFYTDFPVTMRADPVPSYPTTGLTNAVDEFGVGNRTPTGVSGAGISTIGDNFQCTGMTGVTAGRPLRYIGPAISYSAEL